MPDQESKKEEKDRTVVQPAEKDVSLDIENALSFLDSEDDEKAVSPETASKPPARSKPSNPEITADKPIQQKETSTVKPLEKEMLLSRKDQEKFAQRRVLTPDQPEGKKSTKIWILLLGLVILIILAALTFL
jgi:hypothetical protein